MKHYDFSVDDDPDGLDKRLHLNGRTGDQKESFLSKEHGIPDIQSYEHKESAVDAFIKSIEATNKTNESGACNA